MKTLPKKYAAALLATLVLGFGATRLLHAESSPSSKTESTFNATAAVEEMEPGQGRSLPARQWKEGASYVYELDTTRSMTLHKQDGAGQTLRYHVVGKLSLTVMGQESDEVRLRVDLQPTSVEVSPKSEKSGSDFLSGTFYLVMTSRGEIKEFFFPQDIAVEARTLLKGIVNSLQLVVPTTNVAKWQTVEADVSGQYAATYLVRDEFTVEKSKTQYLRTRGPAGFLPMQKDTQYVVTSAATFVLDASGWAKSLTENETLEVSTLGTRITGSIATTAKLSAIENRSEWAGAFPGNLESDKVSEAAAMAMSKKQADINMVGGRSFARISGELNAASKNERAQAQARMAALFRIAPDEAKRAVDEVLHGQGDANSKRRLIGALSNAGTPEAQQELVRLLNVTDAGDLRANAAVALGLSKHPTKETLLALQDATDSSDKQVSNTAVLATGNAVRTMNAEQSGDTTDAVQMLIDGLANASTDAQRQLYLDALGNTGDARVFAAIAPYLSNQSIILRATATSALKFMVGHAADQAIIAAMSDSEMLVRKAAVYTIAFRSVSGVLEALDTLLKTEPEMTVRMEILKAMNVKLAEEALVIDSVRWAMENDPSASVRAYAKKIAEHAAADEG